MQHLQDKKGHRRLLLESGKKDVQMQRVPQKGSNPLEKASLRTSAGLQKEIQRKVQSEEKACC